MILEQTLQCHHNLLSLIGHPKVVCELSSFVSSLASTLPMMVSFSLLQVRSSFSLQDFLCLCLFLCLSLFLDPPRNHINRQQGFYIFLAIL